MHPVSRRHPAGNLASEGISRPRTGRGPFPLPGPAALLALAAFLIAAPASALRVVDYNPLNYPGSSGTQRAPYFRTVLGPLQADVIVLEEIASAVGPTQFLNEVLNVLEPGQWATVPFIDGNDTDATMFYKPAAVQFVGQWAFYPNPANALRLIHVYRLKPVGYTSPAAELRLYAAHLKASQGYEAQRLAECIGLRDSMNVMPAGTHALICGDMNFYTTEPGYLKLLEQQQNNIGRVYDMLPAGQWHDGVVFARYHTQSPCLTGTCASGAATGGLDDRFDFILPTYNLGTGDGLSVLPGTCIPVGNDGQHLNKNITDTPTIPEGADYANAIKLASDHLPLRIDLQLPAKITTDPALAFGPAIVGAPVRVLDLTIGNPAVPPADSLDCTFSAPSGFEAPAATAVPAGSSAAAPVGMRTDSSGPRSGALTVLSDAPDQPSVSVTLSGTVLDHAVASLDSVAVVHSGAIDFGDHEAGQFAPGIARVHNTGYDAYQARLRIGSAVITGSSRFSLAAEFEPCYVAGTGAPFAVLFDDAGAAADSTYFATVTFASADEELPGGVGQPDLNVALRARVIGGGSGAASEGPPRTSRICGLWPNPSGEGTTVRLDIARPSTARLEVFDLFGRRIAVLSDRSFDPGRYRIGWDGRSSDGAPVGAGVYFVRLSGDGIGTRSERLVIVR